jgi:hypothetical protein
MLRSLRARMFLSLVTFGFILIFTVPQVFGRTTPDASQVIGNPQAQSIPNAAITAVFQLYHPMFRKAYYGYTSSVYIQNLGTIAANYVLNFSSGASYTPPTLAPGASTLILATDVTSLPSGNVTGISTLIISSDQPMQSLVIDRTIAGTDRIMAYNGIPDTPATTELRFGPFIKSSTGNASIAVQNVSASVADMTFTLYDSSGKIVITSSITSVKPGSVGTLISSIMVTLPNGTYSVRASSTVPIVGILSYASNDTAERWFRPAMTVSAGSSSGVNNLSVPRFYRSSVDVDGTRSTRLTLLNTSAVAANASVKFYNAIGTLAFTTTQSIAAGGMAFVDPTTIQLSTGFAGSVVISSDQPLGLTELTTYDSGGATNPRTSNADSYTLTSPANSSLMPSFPYLAFGTGEQTVVFAQNVTTQTTDLQLMLSGGFLGTYPRVAPNASARFGTIVMAGAGNYTGMGTITTNALVSVLVDIEGDFLISATPTPTATLTPTSTGTITATPIVTMTATPAGTASATPITTPSATPVGTISATPTLAGTISATPVFTKTPTPMGTISATPTPVGTISATPTLAGTISATPVFTKTPTPAGTISATPTLAGTISATPVFTKTPTPAGTTSATPTTTSISATPTTTSISTTPTTTSISTTPTTTPAVTGTPVATAMPATQIPTPTASAGSTLTPTLYLNYLVGAPGSAFVVNGYNYPAGSSVDLLINDVVAANLTVDSTGNFSLVLQSPSGALPGFYVVTAVVRAIPVAALPQANTTVSRFGVFQLVTSGEGAVVRAAPSGAPTTRVDVPTAVAASPLASPPYTYLPLIHR